jgi:hypothetical protein
MKPDWSNPARRPELHVAARAAAEGVVLSDLDIAASLSAALVVPRLDDARAVERTAQNEFKLHPV